MNFDKSLWRSHQKGDQTRQKILALKQQNPEVSLAELSRETGVKEQQVKRQISALHRSGHLKIAA